MWKDYLVASFSHGIISIFDLNEGNYFFKLINRLNYI